MSPAASPRFLICRLDSTTDVILTLPVACALRDHFPDAWIGWAVNESCSDAIRDHRSIDEVIELPSDWIKTTSGIQHAKMRLREYGCGISIDCQGTLGSALAGCLSGAARRLGFSNSGSWFRRRFAYNECVSPVFSHLTDRTLELLTPLGIHTPQVRWEFPISPIANRWAQRWRYGLQTSRLAIISTSGDWQSKRWEPDRFASTSRYIHDRYGYRSAVICETYEERLVAEEIVTRSAGTAFLAPIIDIAHVAALIKTADLFIGGDCDALHVAVAVGTRSIGLYGPTRPCDTGPYGHIALQRAYEQGSRRRRSSANNAAMKLIGVEHVCQVIDELEADQPAVERFAA